MNRRELLIATGLLPLYGMASASDFAEYMAEQTQGAKSLNDEFKAYQAEYLKEYDAYKQAILKEWDEAKTTTPDTWVSYNDSKKSRTTIDFRKNTIEIAIRANDDPSPEKVETLIKKAITQKADDAIRQDPVLNKINNGSVSLGSILMSGVTLASNTISSLMNKIRMNTEQDSKGRYIKVTAPLPEKSKTDRVRQVLPAAKKYSKEFSINLPLVLAVIHTESAFNPLAQSHIPAFGLMQIVPNSAGKDVQKLIYKRNQAPSAKMLFNPEINIQHGCAYLHILNYRYLKSIKNKDSREYCCIAAYNTGAGNVARAFTGNTNIKAASKIINKMTPDEVYLHLRRNLKYKEARDYVLKVKQHKQLYTV